MTGRRVGWLLSGLMLAGLPVFAHHSFAAQYDEAAPITLTGKVTRVNWKNPHVLLTMDVTGTDGHVSSWRMELGSPNGLMQQGWKVDSLKPGDQVTVSGFRAKDGSNLLNARRVAIGPPGKTTPATIDAHSAAK